MSVPSFFKSAQERAQERAQKSQQSALAGYNPGQSSYSKIKSAVNAVPNALEKARLAGYQGAGVPEPAAANPYGNFGEGFDSYHQDLYNDKKGLYDSQNKNYRDLYESLYNRTQAQNSQNIANANMQAAQQSALAGYNPDMAARLGDRMLSGAYSANQQANQGVNDLRLQTEENIAQNEISLKKDEEQLKREQRQEYIRQLDEFEKIDPEFADKMRMKLFLGQDPGDLKQYLNPDGSIKRLSEAERAIRTQAADYELHERIINDTSGQYSESQKRAAQDWMNQYNRNRSAELLQDSGAFQEASASPEAMKDFLLSAGIVSENGTVNTAKLDSLAFQQNITSIDNTDGLNQLTDAKKGQLIIIEGKPYIMDSLETKKSKGNGYSESSYYDYRSYQVKVIDPLTGQEKSFYRRKRASNW